MRTASVKQLVIEVLASLPRPHTCDVIDDVFYEIEQRIDWRKRYNVLCAQLGKTVVNNWCGYWTSNLEELRGVEKTPAKKSRLIESYSRLTEKVVAPVKKVKEADALKTMAAYFQENKDKLPPAIRNHRETIVELLMTGVSAEEAFSTVVANGA
jgi:hypothetical protein